MLVDVDYSVGEGEKQKKPQQNRNAPGSWVIGMKDPNPLYQMIGFLVGLPKFLNVKRLLCFQFLKRNFFPFFDLYQRFDAG